MEFEPGNPASWKQITEIDGRERKIKFYPTRNEDGLVMRKELIGVKTIEKYQNRDDKVIYRTVRFDCNRVGTAKDYTYEDNYVGKCVIVKMKQEFSRVDYLMAHEQIAKMIVDMNKQ